MTYLPSVRDMQRYLYLTDFNGLSQYEINNLPANELEVAYMKMVLINSGHATQAAMDLLSSEQIAVAYKEHMQDLCAS